jgi:hypothetical protein
VPQPPAASPGSCEKSFVRSKAVDPVEDALVIVDVPAPEQVQDHLWRSELRVDTEEPVDFDATAGLLTGLNLAANAAMRRRTVTSGDVETEPSA